MPEWMREMGEEARAELWRSPEESARRGDPQVPAVFARYPTKRATFLRRSCIRVSARFPSEMTGEETPKLMFPCGSGAHNKAALLLPSLFVQEMEGGGSRTAWAPRRSLAPALLLSLPFPCPCRNQWQGERRSSKPCLRGPGWGRCTLPGQWDVLHAGAVRSHRQMSPRNPSQPPPV